MKSDLSQLTIALISDVFIHANDGARLGESLKHARSRGAELAVLPELPLNPWSPATQTPHEHDAEEPGGPRHQALSDAAHAAGLGVIWRRDCPRSEIRTAP